jgi:hypothetical protein
MKIVETSGDSGFRSELKKDRQEGNRGFGRIGLARIFREQRVLYRRAGLSRLGC